MSNLIAGPWVGEFGWELFGWHGFIRTLSKRFDKVICISRPSMEHIYSDFCSKFISYDPGNGIGNSYLYNGRPYKDNFHKQFVGEDDEWLSPCHLYYYWGSPIEVAQFGILDPTFVKFGTNCYGYDIAIHARNRKHRSDENWSVEKWNKLANHLSKDHSIVSIGSKAEAMHINGTIDKRDVPIKELCDIFRSCNLVVGPSSGPLHLASLSLCPQLVWSKYDMNKDRYHTAWNPFNSEVEYLCDGDPSTKDVLNSLYNLMHRVRK